MQEVDTLANKLLTYMRLNMALKKVDVLIGMGALDTRIAVRSAQLFLDGYADLILFTGGFGKITKDTATRPEAENFKDIAITMGVPEEKIITEITASNTGENIVYSEALLASLDIHPESIMLVTKPYMERRAYATFKKQWKKPQPNVVVTSPQLTYDEHFNATIPKDLFINILVGDVQRIKSYAEQGYQIPQDIPDDVWNAYQRLVELGFNKYIS